MKKILLAMQYWDGDYAHAQDTLGLMAALGPYNSADMIVSMRFDAPELPEELQQQLSNSFNRVFYFRGKRRTTGHPAAPNAMWHELMTHVGLLTRDGHMQYCAVWMLEADAIPVSADWVNRAHREWLSHESVKVMGCWESLTNDRYVEPIGHINGNMLMHPQLVVDVPSLYMTPSDEAWDTWHAGVFKSAGWAPTPLIANRYRETALSERTIQDLVDRGVVLVHGVKDDSVIAWARKKLFT